MLREGLHGSAPYRKAQPWAAKGEVALPWLGLRRKHPSWAKPQGASSSAPMYPWVHARKPVLTSGSDRISDWAACGDAALGATCMDRMSLRRCDFVSSNKKMIPQCVSIIALPPQFFIRKQPHPPAMDSVLNPHAAFAGAGRESPFHRLSHTSFRLRLRAFSKISSSSRSAAVGHFGLLHFLLEAGAAFAASSARFAASLHAFHLHHAHAHSGPPRSITIISVRREKRMDH